MKPNGIRCLVALLLALFLVPNAMAGRMIYDGDEAMKDGALYPYRMSESACLIDAAGNVYADDGYYNISVAVSSGGLRRFIAVRSEGTEMRCYLLDEQGNPLTDDACEYIGLQGDDLIFSGADGLLGAYGWNGEILVEPKYATLYAVGDGSFMALQGESWQIEDGRAERLRPGQSPQSVVLGDGDVTYLGSFIGGVAEACVSDGLSGLVDAEGKWHAAPVYDYVYSVGGGYYSACYGGRTGLINSSGQIVLPFVYDDMTAGSDAAGLKYLAARLDETATVYDAGTMEKLFDVADVSYCWFDSCCASLSVRDADEEGMRVYAMDGSLLAQSDSYGLDVTMLTDDRLLTNNYDTHEYALADPQGNVLLAGTGAPYYVSGEDGVYALTVFVSGVVDTDYGYTALDWRRGRYGLYDLDGHEILPPKYDSIHPVCQGLYAVIRGQWTGVINEQGEWILRRSVYTTLMD